MIKQVFNGKSNGRKPLGRPRLLWEDFGAKHLRKLGAGTEDAKAR